MKLPKYTFVISLKIWQHVESIVDDAFLISNYIGHSQSKTKSRSGPTDSDCTFCCANPLTISYVQSGPNCPPVPEYYDGCPCLLSYDKLSMTS